MKSLLLSLAVFTACSSGLCVAGCYLLHQIPVPERADPCTEEVQNLQIDYMRELESVCRDVPPGPHRDERMAEWYRQRGPEQRQSLREVYRKHGRPLPEWLR